MAETGQKLGRQPVEGERRDAVHVPIIQAVAAEKLKPGQPVSFLNNTGDMAGSTRNAIGIVDPFLMNDVLQGERFWMVLNPGSITSLRHDWEHPLITPQDAAEERPRLATASEVWLQNYAAELGLGYSELIRGAQEFLQTGDFLNRGSLLEGVYLAEAFWDHFQHVTGSKVPLDRQVSFFRCSC